MVRVGCKGLDIIYNDIYDGAGFDWNAIGRVSIDLNRISPRDNPPREIDPQWHNAMVYGVTIGTLMPLQHVHVGASYANIGHDYPIVVEWVDQSGVNCVAIVHRLAHVMGCRNQGKSTMAYCVDREQFLKMIWCLNHRKYLSDYLRGDVPIIAATIPPTVRKCELRPREMKSTKKSQLNGIGSDSSNELILSTDSAETNTYGLCEYQEDLLRHISWLSTEKHPGVNTPREYDMDAFMLSASPVDFLDTHETHPFWFSQGNFVEV